VKIQQHEIGLQLGETRSGLNRTGDRGAIFVTRLIQDARQRGGTEFIVIDDQDIRAARDVFGRIHSIIG
jgi:hypothetical protein